MEFQAMAKTRLNLGHREKLRQLAKCVVSSPVTQRKLDATYERAAPLVRAAVEKIYPPADMAICQRYKAASVDDCIKLDLTAGGVEVFDFNEGTGPLAVKKTYQGQVYQADAKTTQAVNAWLRAREKHKETRTAILADYRALIASARTFEDVVEIWPEAETLRPEICKPNTALTALDESAIKRIKADSAKRMKAAEQQAKAA